MQHLLFLLLSITLILTVTSTPNQLVVLLIDGLRWDFFHEEAFSDIIQHSVKPRYMIPVVPAVSYPNWASLSTGVYTETHGILGNEFYDYQLEEIFQLDTNSTKDEHWWQGAEPIWITATKQKKRVSLHGWSRCDVPYQGMSPERCTGYADIEDLDYELFRKRMDDAMSELKEGFDVVMVYVPQLDLDEHKYGPESDNVTLSLIIIADIIKEFRQNLTKEGLIDKVNVVTLSDHGQTQYTENHPKYVSMNDYIDENDVKFVFSCGGFMKIVTEEDKTEKVLGDLQGIKGVTAYKRSEIPERFHFKNNKNTPDILLVTDNETLLFGLDNSTKQIPDGCYYNNTGGDHSFLPELSMDMMAAMFAWGPDLASGEDYDGTVEAVDMYNLMCILTDIEPVPNNGSMTRIKPLLTDHDVALASHTTDTSFILLFLSLFIHLLGIF